MKFWKHSTTPTKASTAHVEVSQTVPGFWSLAPASAFDRFAKQTKLASAAHEYVWLVEAGVVFPAVVNTETGQVVAGTSPWRWAA